MKDIMKDNELFNLIINTKHEDYNEDGDSVNYLIQVDNENKIVRLIFEQSKSKRDWINNFAFPIKPYKNQKNVLLVSRGYARAYKSCNDKIQELFIKKVNENKNYKIEISGWSFGGAMAILAAEDFYYRSNKKANVITFGTPKILFGKKSKEHILESVESIKQYCNINDLVIYLPPFLFYKHINKIKIGNRFNFFKLFNVFKYHKQYDII